MFIGVTYNSAMEALTTQAIILNIQNVIGNEKIYWL